MTTSKLTEFDKRVYNMWLSITRSCYGKPFKFRSNFDDFESNKNYAYLKKLSTLFSRTPHLMRKEYFEAPYFIYGKTKYYDLKFYSSLKAISAFTKYLKKDINDLDHIVDSFKFIINFCLEKGIELNEYPFYKSVVYNDCLKHIKDHYVSPLIAFIFPELYVIISNLDDDVFSLYYGDMDFEKLQTKYENSPELIELSISCKKKVSKKLSELLKIKNK